MKRSNHQVDMSIDEIMAMLKRTSLPTIVVEGSEDMIVYRHLEESLSTLNVSVLPVGGRAKILEIFSRRTELSSSIKVSFIADQDIWINTGVPSEYYDECLVLTNGYSIENDIYNDGELWNLLNSTEASRFKLDVRAFLKWYALALSRHLRDPSVSIKLHPDHVLNPSCQSSLLSLQEGEAYPEELHDTLSRNYKKTLRGKSLMALLIRHTSYHGREPHHNSKSLMEIVAKRPGPLLNSLYSSVRAFHAGTS